MMLKDVKGLLLDLDGVLYIVDKPVEGAQVTLRKLREKFKIMFITNTTTKPKKVVFEKLIEMGFEVEENEIFSALEATKQFIKKNGGGAYLLLTDLAKKDFEDIPSKPVSYVVIGDARENFNYDSLNRAFRYIMDGAQIVAAARNKYFMDRDGKLSLDCGPFVVGLEFATGKKAVIIGKPSKDFFLLAVSKMGLKPEEVAVVGDDIEADVKGGMDAGLKGILVKTGKFTQSDLEKGIEPDLVIDSINQILEYI